MEKTKKEVFSKRLAMAKEKLLKLDIENSLSPVANEAIVYLEQLNKKRNKHHLKITLEKVIGICDATGNKELINKISELIKSASDNGYIPIHILS